ncbi:MAG: hypothetical protein U9R54_06795 [Bacteroidota bacterium]|nr:hypothetical protein [Bacteroidota bacterium]
MISPELISWITTRYKYEFKNEIEKFAARTIAVNLVANVKKESCGEKWS